MSTITPEEDPSVQAAKDSLLVMRKQECTTYKRNNLLSSPIRLSDCVVDGSWRQRIVEWMYSVVDKCDFNRDSVAVAAHLLDLSLEKGIVSSRREFQICAMAALQLAVKLNDSAAIRLDSMVKLGHGLFNEKDLVQMEMKMLIALDWHVHPPTPECFMRLFHQLLPASVPTLVRYLIVEVTRFVSEISVCLTKFAKYPPSVIAYAGILIAMEGIDDSLLPLRLRQEMFEHMSRIDGMDYDSNEILEAFGELQQSVEGNVCLHRLVNSIYAQGMAAAGRTTCIPQQRQEEQATQCHSDHKAFACSV